ncbi:MAG: terpene cyclase/mutase family protein [bacterium]|nr:terpene cyclase/mutase family protein [bacterium]
MWVGAVATVLGCADVLAAQDRPDGVTPETVTAIERGLTWLEQNQAGDGAFRNAGLDGGNPVAMTALAGMAFVAAGSTPTRGRHWRQVRDAVDWLLQQVDPENGLIHAAGDPVPMFGHGFATLLLASVYGMEEDVRKQRQLKRVLDRAVGLTASAQSTAGGWIYRPDHNDDEGSVTITQMQALRACRMAGIVVDRRMVDRAVDYVKRCQNADGGIRYKLGSPGGSRPAITAAGVAVFYNAGIYDDVEFVAAAHRYCTRMLKVRTDTTGHHYYAHLYWSQALYQRGGSDWLDYYPSIASWLQEQQRPDGSWDGDRVGKVYGTAVALTILQLPYALVPIYQR